MADLTPEHTARRQSDDKELHPEVFAAYRYVERVLDSADVPSSKLRGPLWFGWALREAFLAGCSHTAALAKPEPVVPTDEELDGLFDAHCYTDDFGTHLMDAACFRDGIRAAIAAEREACAWICDKQYERARTSTGAARADACATAIRSRRPTPYSSALGPHRLTGNPIEVAAPLREGAEANSDTVPVTEQNRNFIEDMSVQWQRERAETQMTLGKLIETLEAMPAGAMVEGLHNFHSHRGYYVDLALERTGELRLAVDLLGDCRAVMGAWLSGYKGGVYSMNAATPVWVAPCGDCGEKLITLDAGGRIETKPNSY